MTPVNAGNATPTATAAKEPIPALNKGNLIQYWRTKLGKMQIWHYLSLTTLLALSFGPLLLLFIDSGKTTEQFESHPWSLTTPYHWSNYWRMLVGMRRYMVNSSFVSLVAIPLALLIASYTSYIFARFKFYGKEFLFNVVIFLMMIPFVLYLVPQYILIQQLGLLNSLWALIFPYAAGGAVFGVFLIRPFMASLSEELFEAARLDGATDWQVFYSIALPLCRPILATLMILLLLGQWNDLIWPSVTLTNQDMYTVTLGVFSLGKTVYGGMAGRPPWGMMFAAFVISSLPLLLVFIIARKAFLKGLSSGALKF